MTFSRPASASTHLPSKPFDPLEPSGPAGRHIGPHETRLSAPFRIHHCLYRVLKLAKHQIAVLEAPDAVARPVAVSRDVRDLQRLLNADFRVLRFCRPGNLLLFLTEGTIPSLMRSATVEHARC